MPLKRRLLTYVFDRYYRYRVQEFMLPEQAIVLDYRVDPKPRYQLGEAPHPQLGTWFDERRAACGDYLRLVGDHRASLERIPERTNEAREPFWRNDWFSILDGMGLYSLVAASAPKRIVEIGSGNSTKFAARAIRDLRLGTTVTSIDPKPRAEIDALCTRVVRRPLEAVPQEVFAELEAGDFLFVDSSHRAFTNSDVTTLFLEIIPRLPPGIVCHIHDIFLPWDYPNEWSNRYYSEQYLLACVLLNAPRRFELIGANAFISFDPALRAEARRLVENSPLKFMFQPEFVYGGVARLLGTSLWLRTA